MHPADFNDLKNIVHPPSEERDRGISPESVGESGAKVTRIDYFVPDPGEGAEILEGSTDEILDQLIELLKSKGGIK